VIQLEVQRPVCLELYQDCKDLGRFMLRSGGNTIAAGVVTKVGKCISANLSVTQDVGIADQEEAGLPGR